MRVACLWIPELPLVAVLRAEPALVAEKLAVVQAPEGEAQEASAGLSSRLRILGATRAAEGVRAGQTLAEARALCPELRVRAASPERMRAAAQAALDAAASVSPRLEEAAPGLVFLDVEGLGTLVGDDRAVAHALLRAGERVGLCAAVGLAEGKVAAQLAARAAAAGL
jgi:protein ImuB